MSPEITDDHTKLAVVAVLIAFVAAWAVLMSVKLTIDATDVPRYYIYGEAMRDGHVPYRDYRVEYPPAALAVFGLPALANSGYRGYRIAFEVLMAACACGVMVASTFVLVRLRERVVAPIAFMAAATLGLGPIALGHFDLWPALLVSAALATLLWDHTRTAAVLVGLAIAAKIYALLLVPIAIIWIWHQLGARRAVAWAGTAAATVLLCFVPFIVASPGGVLWSIKDQINRPLQLESSAAAALLAAHQLVSLPVGVVFSYSSVNLGGTSATAGAVASAAAEIVLLLFVYFVFAKGAPDRQSLVRSSTAAILAFVVLGKVFSPQFLIWLIPLFPLLGGSLALGGSVALGAAILLTRSYFPGRWADLIHLRALPTWLLVTRNLLLLGVLTIVVVGLSSRRERPPRQLH
ncbi:MAG: DUF2029 domain-containing protein [Actinobacteria bacterium]|nr:DUF2029 domain-containing protein [Actinomycetota bacterium]